MILIVKREYFIATTEIAGKLVPDHVVMQLATAWC
jgi:hypothetical protein